MFPMSPKDTNKLYLWMGLSHPYFGPANLAWYSTFMAYGWYLEWVKLVMRTADFTDPNHKSG